MIFPQGLQYDRKKNEYLTTRPNRMFELISPYTLTDDPEKNKSRMSNFFLATSGSVQWVGRLSNFLAASLQRYEKPIHLTLKNDFEGMKLALKPD